MSISSVCLSNISENTRFLFYYLLLFASMNKKSLMVWGVVVSAIILTGCFGTKKEQQTEEFTVAVCNDYVQLMRCIIDKSEENNVQGNAIIDQTIAAWKNLPEADLQQACTQAWNNATPYASTYAEMGCNIPNIAISDNEETEVSEENTVDASVIDSISGEVEVSNTTPPSTTNDNTITVNDAEVVSGIVDGITGSNQ